MPPSSHTYIDGEGPFTCTISGVIDEVQRCRLLSVCGSTRDVTTVPHLEKLEKALSCKVSDQDDGVQYGRGVVRRLTDGPSIGVSSMRVEFHYQILDDFL